ncbi:MAG: ATP-binding protein, partial [Brachybacterium sp.]|nr:ATP-binding protein [Brachybacterium sp.]
MHPAALTRELEALRTLLVGRLEAHLVAAPIDGSPLPLPDLDPAVLAPALDGREPTPQEHVLLLLALVPHLDPDFFSGLVAPYLPEGGELPVFGGVRTENHRGVLPTGETAQFVLAGDDLGRRLEVGRLLSGDHWLTQRRLLWLDGVREGEPVMSGRLILDSELVERLTTGGISLPRFSSSFPAEHVQTELDWDDVVLHPTTVRQIGEIEDWVRHEHTAREDWGMGRRVARGYRALFHGAPGTGKTLTAMLLGRSTGRAVFRIDLSRVVSKYIGETEKNLAGLFDKAEHKDWILFFDEADALFGKRTEIRDAHDKYANQEVAFLL